MYCQSGPCNVGHADLITLLVKRKASLTSTNKSGKTAADLAKSPEAKAILQEAAATAAAPQSTDATTSSFNQQSDKSASNQQEQAAPQQAEEPANEAAPEPQGGPSEGRPGTKPCDKGPASSDAQSSMSRQVGGSDMSLKGKQQNADRPAKKQKVALSFAEEEDDI